jgi:hypothetical protein
MDAEWDVGEAIEPGIVRGPALCRQGAIYQERDSAYYCLAYRCN